MGKKSDAIYAEILKTLQGMQNPASNPAQQYLTNEALAGADWLKKGEYSQMPKGMFFDFSAPAENIKQYNKYANVGREGTFALGDSSGLGSAMGTQSKYLGDKFARDAGLNYQQNIAGAANQIRGALGQSSGANSQNNQAILGALTNLYSNMPKGGGGFWGGLLGAAGQIGASALTKW